jgi:hypothetical protein
MKRRHRSPGRLRQQYRTRFGKILRPARPINRKRHRLARLDLPPHPQQRTHRPPAARAPHGAKAQWFDNARNELAVEAEAGHHANALPAKQRRRRENALMPKGVNRGPGNALGRSPIFLRPGKAQRRTQRADDNISQRRNNRERNALPQREPQPPLRSLYIAFGGSRMHRPHCTGRNNAGRNSELQTEATCYPPVYASIHSLIFVRRSSCVSNLTPIS